MANRPYLYSDDRPDLWDCPEDHYHDARWNFPLAWWFFFRPEDVHFVDIPTPQWMLDINLFGIDPPRTDMGAAGPGWQSFPLRPADPGHAADPPRETSWQEVRLRAEKAPALGLFKRRKPALMALIGDQLPGEVVADFAAIVGRRPGRYLFVDSSEMDWDCPEDAARIAGVLEALGDGSAPLDELRNIRWPMLGRHVFGSEQSDPFQLQDEILGGCYE